MTSLKLPGAHAPEHLGAFQFIILVLSFLTLGAVAADTFLALPREVDRIIQALDLFACSLFFVDFLVRFRRAESKSVFMRTGWIDLIACIPNVELFRVGRLVRVLRVIRLLRGIRSLQRLFQVFFSSREKGGVTSVVTTAFLLVVFSSVGILICEQDPSANIKTASDAIWWSVTTATTVGYGDRFPVTEEGRILGMALMCSGVGLFSVLSGIVASSFLGKTQDSGVVLAEVKTVLIEIQNLRDDLKARQQTR
jgi:voltage-gated potassium channel